MIDQLITSEEDNIKLGDITEENYPALYVLLEGYKELSSNHPDAIILGDVDTVGDLKEGISKLPAKVQLQLLKDYADQHDVENVSVEEEEMTDQPSENTKSKNPTNKDDVFDFEDVLEKIWTDTILRRWIVKTVIITISMLLFMVIGGALAVGVISGSIKDGVFVNTILNSSIEVVKLFFGFSE